MPRNRDYSLPRHTNDSKIAQARLKAGMTQGQLAEAMGIRASQIGNWENGYRKPKMDALMRIAAVLGIDWTTLI